MDERTRSRRILTLRDGVAIALALLVVPTAALAGLRLPIHSSGALAPIFSAPATPVGQVGTTSSEAISFPPVTRDDHAGRSAAAPADDATVAPPADVAERGDGAGGVGVVRSALREPSPAIAAHSAPRLRLGVPKAAGGRGPGVADRDEPGVEGAPPTPGAPVTPDPGASDDPGGADRPAGAGPDRADDPGTGTEPSAPEGDADGSAPLAAPPGATGGGTADGGAAADGQDAAPVADETPASAPAPAPGPGKGKGKPKKADAAGGGSPAGGSANGGGKPKRSAPGGTGR